MTDTDKLYHSRSPVPDRVDRAWEQGYVAGKAEKRATVALIISTFTAIADFTRGRRHLFGWAVSLILITTVLALLAAIIVVPCVFGYKGVRFLIRRHGKGVGHSPVTVTLNDGSTF